MEPNSPYIYRDGDERDPVSGDEPTADEDEVVIVDGHAMQYRSYRR